MTTIAELAQSLFTQAEKKRIKGIYEKATLTEVDREEARKALRQCLLDMSALRESCRLYHGSEFVAKSGEIMKQLKKLEVKLEAMGALSEGDFSWLTSLMFHKSTYSSHVIERAVRGITSVQ